MTAWEYGFVHAVGTTAPASDRAGYVQRWVFLVADGTGLRHLEGCNDFITAANRLGSDGWYIEWPGVSRDNINQAVMDLISKLKNVGRLDGQRYTRYFMRREASQE